MAFELRRQDQCGAESAHGFLSLDLDCYAHSRVEEHIFVDHGLPGTIRARPGPREAMATVRAADTLVVSKLDRLARSLPDAQDITDELTANGVSLSLAESAYDPADPRQAAPVQRSRVGG